MAKMRTWLVFGLALSLVLGIATIGLGQTDKLTYLFYGEPGEADPATAYDARSSTVINNVYDRLLTYEGDDATTFAPMLAESWSVSDDGLVITFNLRQDATFHDGSPVNA